MKKMIFFTFIYLILKIILNFLREMNIKTKEERQLILANAIQFEHDCVEYCNKVLNIKTWHWSDVPEEHLFNSGYIQKYGSHRLDRLDTINKVRDCGFDMLMVDENNNYHSGQCKKYTDTSVSGYDIAWFWGKQFMLYVYNKESKAYLFTTTKLTRQVEDTLNNINSYNKTPIFTHILVSDDMFTINNSINKLNNRVINKTIDDETTLKRFDYQVEIVDKLYDLYTKPSDEEEKTESNRVNKILLTLPCGMGKTVIAGDILKKLNNKLVIALAPEKMQVENLRDRIPLFLKDYKVILFDSDSSVGGFTDDQKLVSILQKNKKDKILILSTFRSAETKLNQLIKTNKTISDLFESLFLLVDEVHNVMNRNNICEFINWFKTGLFMTATLPKDLEDVIDIDYYIDEYNFSYGLKHNYIVDYNVYIPSLSVNDKSEYESGVEVPVELSELNNTDNLVEKVLFLFSGMLKTGARKCIVYLGTKDQCKQFNTLFESVGRNYHGLNTWSKIIVDDTNMKTRINIINEFQEGDRSILHIISSCGCLDEAVDIPKCDSEYITIVGKETSEIRTVQRLMRGGRKDINNPHKINSLFLWSSDYNNLINCLQLLKINDTQFTKKIKIICGNYDKQEEKECKDLVEVSNNHMKSVLIKCLSLDELWDHWYEKVKEFLQNNENKYPSSESKNKEEHFLGSWVLRQRRNYSIKKLDDKRIKKLEEIIGWKWLTKESTEERTFDQSYDILQQYIKNNKDNKIPTRYNKDEEGKRLGRWLSKMKEDYSENKLDKDRIKKLEKIKGWKWSEKDTKKFIDYDTIHITISNYLKQNKNVYPKQYGTTEEEITMYKIIKNVKEKEGRGTMNETTKNNLAKLPGWSWLTKKETKNKSWDETYKLVEKFIIENNNKLPKETSKDTTEKSLGKWLSRQNSTEHKEKLEKNGKIKELNKLYDLVKE
jgi:superfamily II DNA or RNA helicase